MNKNEKIILGAASFFSGLVTGFLIGSIKKGICFRKNTRNNYGDNSTDENGELDKVLDEVLDIVNGELDNTTKEKNEEVVD